MSSQLYDPESGPSYPVGTTNGYVFYTWTPDDEQDSFGGELYGFNIATAELTKISNKKGTKSGHSGIGPSEFPCVCNGTVSITDDEGYILEEFKMDAFERSFRLDPSIAKEKITAEFKDGILTLTFIDVPKEEERERRLVELV